MHEVTQSRDRTVLMRGTTLLKTSVAKRLKRKPQISEGSSGRLLNLGSVKLRTPREKQHRRYMTSSVFHPSDSESFRVCVSES